MCVPTHLALHCTLFIPPINKVFNDTVCLLQEPLQYKTHFADPVVFLDYRLMLVHNKGDTFEQCRECRDIVER